MHDPRKEEGKAFHNLQGLETHDYLWDKGRGLGSETWKGCE